MRKIFTIIIFCSLIIKIYSDDYIEERYSIASKIFVTDYNNGNYEKIWKMTDKNFQSNVAMNDLKFVLASYKSTLGKILSIEEPVFTRNICIFEVRFQYLDCFLLMLLDNNDKFSALTFASDLNLYGVTIYPKVNGDTTVAQLAETYLRMKAASGLAIGIIENGKTEKYFYGEIKKDSKIKPDENTVFEIGDVTEVFTAVALLELQNQKVIDLNNPISKYLPANLKAPAYNGVEISIKNLLTNTSTLPSIPYNLEETIKNPLNPYANYTFEDLYSFLADYKINKPIGLDFEYSNLGFGLIGHIMELKTGISFGEIIRKEICSKLGMKNTEAVLNTDQKLKLAQGYLADGKPAEYWDNYTLAGAGALKSTLSDMLIFLQENITPKNDALGEAVKYSQQVQIIPKNSDFKQASGWEIIKVSGKNVIWKYGGTGGFRCGIAFIEGGKSGVVVMTNSSVDCSDLLIKLIELMLYKTEKKDNKESRNKSFV